MILSPNTKTGTGKKTKEVEGERAKAQDFFNKLPNDIQTKIRAASVLLESKDKTKGKQFIGSGVIFYADVANAYVVTAKHNLYKAAEKKPTETKPTDLTASFIADIQIAYNPPVLEQRPTATALFQNISLPEDTDNWEYDLMVLESNDANFMTFVQNSSFIQNNKDAQDNLNLLKVGESGAPALKKETYDFIQTGYGHWKDADLPNTQSWEDHPGTFQCRITDPKDTKPADTVYDIDPETPEKNWENSPTLTNVCLLTADNNNSTAPGDSGGPLFSVPKNKPAQIYLVGVTLGANFYITFKNLQPKPTNARIDNNATTYWDVLLKEWIGSIPH